MRVLSSRLFNLLVFFVILLSFCAGAKAPELGVAIDPLKIKVKENRMVYFNVINDTENDYIVTTKVVNALTKKILMLNHVFSQPTNTVTKEKRQGTNGGGISIRTTTAST